MNALCFIKVKVTENCIVELKKFIMHNKWKGVRITTKGLYALEFLYDAITVEGLKLLNEIFIENIPNFPGKIVNILVSCTIRILFLDKNNLGIEGAIIVGKFLETNRSLLLLSLADNGIGFEGADKISKALTTNIALKHLNLASNSIDNFGITKIARALRVKICLNFVI